MLRSRLALTILLVALAITTAVARDVSRRLPTPAAAGSGPYSLTEGADGGVYLSWVETSATKINSLKFSRLDAGRWTPAMTVTSGRDWFVNWADHPSVTAMADGALVAHWLVNNPGSTGYGYGIRIARSADRGRTWREIFKAGIEDTSDYSGFVSFLAGRGVSAVYLTPTRATGAPPPNEGSGHSHGHVKSLKIARFGSNGELTSDVLVDADVCTCCTTSIVETAAGPIAAYRDHQGGVRDISVVRYRDGRWTAPSTVHRDNWEIDGCPTNGPVLAARGSDVAIAWFTAAGDVPRVRVAFSRDAGAHFDPPVAIDGGKPFGYPSIVMLDDGGIAASWLEATTKGDGEVRLRRVWSDRRLGEVTVVAPAKGGRLTGLPKLARNGDQLIVAWRDGRVLSAMLPVPAR